MARSALPRLAVLQGRYRIERTLGSGGFGITYYGHDERLDRPVAIKEYFPEQFASRDNSLNVTAAGPTDRTSFELGRGWFLREAQTLARYRHANIVAVIDHFEENATAYMVLAYEPGRPLTKWLADLHRPPTQAEIDAINLPLLSALEAMHAGGHLHRDVAPDNIILRPDGSPVLIDFGSARQSVGQKTRTAAVVKLGYSPFEQYSSDTAAQGPWSDMYALAATWYFAIVGQLPPDAAERMFDDAYKPLASGNYPDYRPGFLAGIDQALRPNFKDRPRTIAEWRVLLNARRAATPAARQQTQMPVRDENVFNLAVDPYARWIDAALIVLAVIANMTFWALSGQNLYTSSAADLLGHHLPPAQWIALAVFLFVPTVSILARRWCGHGRPETAHTLVAFAGPWMLFPLTYLIGACLLLLAILARKRPKRWHGRAVMGIGGGYIGLGWLTLLPLLWVPLADLTTVFPLLAAAITSVGLAGIFATPRSTAKPLLARDLTSVRRHLRNGGQE